MTLAPTPAELIQRTDLSALTADQCKQLEPMPAPPDPASLRVVRALQRQSALIDGLDAFFSASFTASFIAYYVRLGQQQQKGTSIFAWVLLMLGAGWFFEPALEVLTGAITDHWGRRMSVVLSATTRALVALTVLMGTFRGTRIFPIAAEISLVRFGMILADVLFSGSLDAWLSDRLKLLPGYHKAWLSQSFFYGNFGGASGFVLGSLFGALIVFATPREHYGGGSNVDALFAALLVGSLCAAIVASIWMDEPYRRTEPAANPQIPSDAAGKPPSLMAHATNSIGIIRRDARIRLLVVGRMLIHPFHLWTQFIVIYLIDRFQQKKNPELLPWLQTVFAPLVLFHGLRLFGSWLGKRKAFLPSVRVRFRIGTLVAAMSGIAIMAAIWLLPFSPVLVVWVLVTLFGISKIGLEMFLPQHKAEFNHLYPGTEDRATAISLQAGLNGAAAAVVALAITGVVYLLGGSHSEVQLSDVGLILGGSATLAGASNVCWTRYFTSGPHKDAVGQPPR